MFNLSEGPKFLQFLTTLPYLTSEVRDSNVGLWFDEGLSQKTSVRVSNRSTMILKTINIILFSLSYLKYILQF